MSTESGCATSQRLRLGGREKIQGRTASRREPRTRTAVAALAALGLTTIALGGAEAQILGTAEDFGVLAGTTATNTGPSVINGNVGVSPGGAVIGFPPGIVVAPGTIHAADATAAQAQIDLTTAYNTLQGLPSQFNLTGQNLGGMTLLPAVYSFANTAQLTGVLTLNGQGNTAAQFVFQIGSALTTASNSAVLLINGANGNNVYWAVGSSATLGTNSVFAGNIVALTSITLNTGASITCGRALARNGAVTLDTNVITLCAAGGDAGDITDNDLFGEGVSGAQQTAFGASSLFASALMDQAAGLGEGPGQDQNQPQNSLKDSVPSGGSDGLAAGGYPASKWRMWTTAFGGAGSLQGEAARGSAGLDSRTAGIAVGIEYRIDRTASIGIAGGYSRSHFSVDDRSTSGSVEGVHAGVYGVKRFGRFYLAGAAEYAHYSNDTDRFIDWVVDEQATGKFSSDVVTGRVEAGVRQWLGVHRVTPFVGLQIAHLRSDGFSENSQTLLGAPGILGLTFDSNSVTSVQSSVGIQVDSRQVLPNGQTLTPFARVAWVHEFNPERSVSSFLTASPGAAFSPFGAFAASDFAKVNLGLKLDITRNMGVFGYFDGEFSDRGQTYGGTGGIRISW